jgi:hypothetical protein
VGQRGMARSSLVTPGRRFRWIRCSYLSHRNFAPGGSAGLLTRKVEMPRSQQGHRNWPWLLLNRRARQERSRGIYAQRAARRSSSTVSRRIARALLYQAVVACALGICAGGLGIDYGFHCSGRPTGSAGGGPRCRQDAAPGCVDGTSGWSCCSGLEERQTRLSADNRALCLRGHCR